MLDPVSSVRQPLSNQTDDVNNVYVLIALTVGVLSTSVLVTICYFSVSMTPHLKVIKYIINICC